MTIKVYQHCKQVLIADANKALKEELKSIKLAPEGVYVQASTLGSLEALLQFLKDSKIKYSGVSIGELNWELIIFKPIFTFSWGSVK